MITNFKIDQTATFPHGVVFLACEPTIDRDSKEQARVKSTGQFKWTVHTLVGMRNQFGALGFETFKVGLSTDTAVDPCAGLGPQTPVHLVDLEIGVMEKTRRDPNTKEERVIGVNVWYRAGEVRSTADTGRRAA